MLRHPFNVYLPSLQPYFSLIRPSFVPIPVAARSKAYVCGRSPAEIVRSNPTAVMDACCKCCVLSGRGLCDELITRPEESYRLWRVVLCNQETSKTKRLNPDYWAVKIQTQWVVNAGKSNNKQQRPSCMFDKLIKTSSCDILVVYNVNDEKEEQSQNNYEAEVSFY
jgi:hypothetical protein